MQSQRLSPLDRQFAEGRPITLRDGTIGYHMRSVDDCLAPAVATLVQVPLGEVPELRSDARLAAGEDPEAIAADIWRRLSRWLARRGLRVVVHEQRLPTGSERWIGVVCPSSAQPFTSHCIVMSGTRKLHDPWPATGDHLGLLTKNYGLEAGFRHIVRFRPDQITYGIDLVPK